MMFPVKTPRYSGVCRNNTWSINPQNIMKALFAKRDVSPFLISALTAAASAGSQTGQPSAQTTDIVFPQLLSPTGSVPAAYRFANNNQVIR